MTLNTKLEILDPSVDPEKIFHAVRTEVGIPEDHPYTVVSKNSTYEWCRQIAEENEVWFWHVPGGFNAQVNMRMRLDPPEPQMIKEDEDYEYFDSGWIIRLDLDTAYGGLSDLGGSDYHIQVFEKACKNLGITQFRVQDEFSGDWFTDWESAHERMLAHG